MAIHPLLAPYKPTPEDPFDRIKAAHLLNRAGFGGTPREIARVLEMGPGRAVNWLMDFPSANADEISQIDVPDLSMIDGYPPNFREVQKQLVGKTEEEKKAIRQQQQQANRQAVDATMAWWIKRMTFGPYPLQEKLTLFWHGHFTTSAKDERSASLIWNQNELLRRNAAGNFREFVRSISRDPAMLDYLNNNQNRKAHPNENYARELMELFTLGIGNYTENDIKEAARAFTGWAHDGEDFIFRKFDHDTGQKTFFGQRGDFDGDNIIDIILQHPACAPYIASGLFSYFVYEDPEPALRESLGQILRDNHWDMRPLLTTVLTSKAFYQPRAIGSQIKSPLQLLTGTVRMLEIDFPPNARQITGALEQMGQVPLMPPNVKGWPGGRNWINTSTLFVRYNTAVWLAGGDMQMSPLTKGNKTPRTFNAPNTGFAPDAGKDGPAVVDLWIDRLIQRPVDGEKKKTLLAALGDRPDREENVRKMVQLIVSMPEYQLC